MDQTVEQMLEDGLVERVGESKFKLTEKGIKLLGMIKREHPEEFMKMAEDMGWVHTIH